MTYFLKFYHNKDLVCLQIFYIKIFLYFWSYECNRRNKWCQTYTRHCRNPSLEKRGMHNHNKQNVPYGICWRGGHNSIFQCQHFLKTPVIWGQFYQHVYVQLLHIQIQKHKKAVRSSSFLRFWDLLT